MRAIIIDQFGGRDVLKLADVPEPVPGPGEVLIAVKAAGVNPVDWKIRTGYLEGRLPHEFPIILGWDVAGVVAAVDSSVSSWNVGDEVYAYARKPIIQAGTYAEYIAVDAAHIARKPTNFSFVEAASVPLAALTAYQSLFDAARLTAEETVLVEAAAGGVGGFAVQLARHAGARVFGTASSVNHDYVRELGAEHVIDYRQQDVVAEIQSELGVGVDVAYDCIGGDVFARCAAALKPGGRIVTILEPIKTQELADQGVSAHYVFVSPNGAQLEKLRQLAESGDLKTHVSATVPLADAAQAHELIESAHTRGKIVLTI